MQCIYVCGGQQHGQWAVSQQPSKPGSHTSCPKADALAEVGRDTAAPCVGGHPRTQLFAQIAPNIALTGKRPNFVYII